MGLSATATGIARPAKPGRVVHLLVVPVVRLQPSPIPAAEHKPCRRTALLFLEPLPLSTKVIDFGVHPSKEKFSRGGGEQSSEIPMRFVP